MAVSPKGATDDHEYGFYGHRDYGRRFYSGTFHNNRPA
jgi:hypothetical protein